MPLVDSSEALRLSNEGLNLGQIRAAIAPTASRMAVCRAIRRAKEGRVARECQQHGRSHTLEYRSYTNAKSRCENPRDKSWPKYGGRGVEFRFTSFEQFFAELGPRPSPAHSIDRIEVNGHYEPGNVRWATHSEQMSNRRPWTRKKAA